MDKDLQSIQEARDLLVAASQAQEIYAGFSQEQVDEIVKEVSEEARKHVTELAKMACEETGFGNWEDKVIKNKLAAIDVYESFKNEKTVGILNEYKDEGIIEIGVPMGVIAALIPSTNPTSTAIYKVLISLKAGNGVVVSPHPNAKNCVIDTVKLMQKAAVAAGAPEGLIGVIEIPTIEGTNELMRSKDTSIILATGGEAMVRAAYSSGRPAIGVGPGNGPAYIEKTANVKEAVRKIIESKTFDNGVICASEQSVIVEPCNKEAVMDEFRRQGGFFLSKEESDKLGKFILGASIGLFGSGFTTGAGIVLTSGPFIFNGSTFLLTSFGEIRASISTSFVGSLIFLKFTNPHSLFPLVAESIDMSFLIFTPPVVPLLLEAFQLEVFSFPGVIGPLFVPVFSGATPLSFSPYSAAKSQGTQDNPKPTSFYLFKPLDFCNFAPSEQP